MEKSDAWLLTENLHLQRGQADPFSAAIRQTRTSMIITDPSQDDNPIIFANDAFLEMTGYAREEVLNRNCRFLQGKDTDRTTVQQICDAVGNIQDISVEILNYRKDGTPFWNSLYLSPVCDAAGVAQYFFASQFDITERKQAELSTAAMQTELERLVASRTAELKEALNRSNLLLHEVDHRVKNNLQMISAMLMLQSMSIPDVNIKNTLREMLERVEAIGLVHKRLYQSENVTDFDICEFAREIAGNLVGATGRSDISLVVEAEPVSIKADAAASIALIVNETITNALKHAFSGGKGGELSVAVKPVAGMCEILIRDNGKGMPEQDKLIQNFGSTLILALVKQLRATIEWLPAKPGTLVKIRIPLG